MTALNLLFRNANGIVIHGNSLSLEVWRAWAIKGTYLGGTIAEVPEDQLFHFKEMLAAPFERCAQERAAQELAKTVSSSSFEDGQPINNGVACWNGIVETHLYILCMLCIIHKLHRLCKGRRRIC